MEGFRSSQPREGAAARGFRARSTFGACRASGSKAGFADRIGFGWVRSSLFDKSIGRKRDVGGVVLAGSLSLTWVSGPVDEVPDETTDGHVSKDNHRARLLEPERREAGWLYCCRAGVFGTRQDDGGAARLRRE